MFAPPTIDQVCELAREFGISLSPQDAETYRASLIEQLGHMDMFLDTRMDEGVPELLCPERAPGWRPTAEEDPHNAWLWKCDIGEGDAGPLAGRTVSFKDHVSVAGIPLTFGSRAFEGFIPTADASVVRKVLAGGGRITGKNTHHGFSGLRSMGGGLGDFWDAINPRNPKHQAGGSSSGPAAAVAAGEVDIAIGGDQGGSIRQPAAYCGVIGLKPTFGLVSHAGAFYGGEPSIDHLGPIARTVDDVALALEAIAGYDGQDSRQGRDVPESVDVVRHVHDGVRGLRIGILKEGFGDPIDERIAATVTEQVERLAAAGAIVSRISIPEHVSVLQPAGALQLSGYRAVRGAGPFVLDPDVHVSSSMVAAINRVWAHQADLMAGYMKLTWLMGEFSHRFFDGTVRAKAQNVRPGFIRAYDRAFAEVDVIALPTSPQLAPLVDVPEEHSAAWRQEIEVLGQVFPLFRNVQPFNYTGHPAIAVPVGEVDGLAVSVQLVGRYYDESTLLRFAQAVHVSPSKTPTKNGESS